MNDRFSIPNSVSEGTADALKTLYCMQEQAGSLDKPITLADYDAANSAAQKSFQSMQDALYVSSSELGHESVIDGNICGIPVVLIQAKNVDTNLAPLVYVHGGGFVTLSASTTTMLPRLIAASTRRRVVSIDYVLAPRADFQQVTNQVATVWQELIEQGNNPSSMGLFGDSAGGNIILASALKMRDQGIQAPGALYAISPATDLTFSGDTFVTLGKFDPALDDRTMPWMREAYVGSGDARNPYASPVYGDFSKRFPPTLIQGGTREFLLSDFVRQYQAIRAGGNTAILDLYEGMPHVFQAFLHNTSESKVAINRAAKFFDEHLA